MNYLNIKYFVLLSILSLTAKATVTYESINSSGSGCPLQDITVTPAYDNRTNTVFFESNSAEIKNTLGKSINEQKSCTIEAKYHANYDEQYVLTSSDWRTYVNVLPDSTTATFKTETWLSYLTPTGTFTSTPKKELTKTVVGPYVDPYNSDLFLSSNIPEAKTVTECGQSFTLNTKVTYSLKSTNLKNNISIGLTSLDLAQTPESTSIKKIPCLHPWNAELDGSINNGTINIKVSTEKTKINQLASLYTVGLYNGKFYSYAPDKNGIMTWFNIDFQQNDSNNPYKSFLPYGSGNAPETFNFPIDNLSSAFKGAVIYVGVGYGPDEETRHKDMLNTLRYKLVYTIK